MQRLAGRKTSPAPGTGAGEEGIPLQANNNLQVGAGEEGIPLQANNNLQVGAGEESIPLQANNIGDLF